MLFRILYKFFSVNFIKAPLGLGDVTDLKAIAGFGYFEESSKIRKGLRGFRSHVTLCPMGAPGVFGVASGVNNINMKLLLLELRKETEQEFLLLWSGSFPCSDKTKKRNRKCRVQ